jgi:hypothetical protein
MKRYFTLIIALMASISFCYSMEAVSCETKKVSFVQSERKKLDCDDFERSNNFPILEAFYNSESNDVEIELYNIGTANIYIVDISGAVAYEAIVETTTYTSLTLSSALCKEDFYIVVDSDYIYAEGYVCK